MSRSKFIIKNLKSISFYFPDPWFKKKHYKRRIIQPDFINILSNSLQKGSLIFIKTDVKDLFDYMVYTISSNLNFKNIDKKDLIQTTRIGISKAKNIKWRWYLKNSRSVSKRLKGDRTPKFQ